MRRSTHPIVLLSVILLAPLMLPGLSRSQSGRGRPRVSTPGPRAPEPQPVTIPAAVAVVKQEQSGNVSRFFLRNGITIIISEQHSAPIVASVACFKAGIRDDPEVTPGIARLVGHAVISGASRPIADLRALGSDLRVDTSLEVSTYSIVVPSAKIKEALAAQADALQHFSADAEQLRREVALLIEEERWFSSLPTDSLTFRGVEVTPEIKGQNPSAYSMARLLNIASPASPLARPLNPQKLSLITRDQVETFYRTQYRPDKLIIVVAGDVVPFNTLIQLQQLYAGFGVQAKTTGEPGRNVPQQGINGSSPPTLTGARRVDQAKTTDVAQPPRSSSTSIEGTEQSKLCYGEDRGDLNQPVVSIGYRVPGAESKDWAVIEVLSALMGGGRASRLYSSMINSQIVASRVDSIYLARTNAAMLVFQIWPAGDAPAISIDKAESAFFREIDRLRHEVPTEAEMIRARALLEKRFLDRIEGYVGRAKELARAEALFGGFRAAIDYRTAIGAVQAEDVHRAAARYLSLSNTSVHEYEPLIAPPRTFDVDSFSATVQAWAPEIAGPVTAPNPRPAEAGSELPAARGAERSTQQQAEMESIQPLPVKDFSTLNGPRAFIREDRSLPKVTVALLFQGGRLVEGETTSGTSEMMLRSMLYGTARRTGQQLAQELEQLGGEVELVIEPDFFGFMLSVESRNAEHSLRLLRDCIEEPAFRDDDIQRARVAQIGEIRNARDVSLARAREMLSRALYPGTAYALPPHGREEVVAKVTSDQLRNWHSQAVKRQLPLAIIVGDTNGSALVSSQLAEAFRRRDLDTSLPIRIPGAPKPADQIELRRQELTTVAIGLSGPKASDSPGQLAVRVIAAAMNGTGGALDRELVRKGLAVMTSLGSDSSFAVGTIYAQIVVPPGNEQRARSALLAEIDRVAKNGLSADELASSRALAAGTNLAALQSQRERALEYARAVVAQRQASDVDQLPDRLLKVTGDDIKRTSASYLKAAASSGGIVRSSLPEQSAPKQD